MTRRGVWACLAVGAALALPSVASAATKFVYAGGPVKWATELQRATGAGVDNFLINRVTINVGDSVTWSGATLASGFHTVDIPAVGGSDQPLIVNTGRRIGNNVTDAAGNPFWFAGKLNFLSFNPVLFTPTGGTVYDGTSRINSGLPLGPPHDFTVKFTTPGKFNYFCDVHYGMGGQVIVLPAGEPIPSAKEDAATLAALQRHYTAEAKRVARTTTSGPNVSVGASGPGGLEVFAMFPGTLRIKAGTTVTFSMSKDTRETHTASFGPFGYLRQLAKGFTANPLDPRSTYPSSPFGEIIPLNSASHGNGFANTGALDRDSGTPLPPLNRIRFTNPGVYNYVCLIHPFMHGTVIVTPAATTPPPPSVTG